MIVSEKIHLVETYHQVSVRSEKNENGCDLVSKAGDGEPLKKCFQFYIAKPLALDACEARRQYHCILNTYFKYLTEDEFEFR